MSALTLCKLYHNEKRYVKVVATLRYFVVRNKLDDEGYRLIGIAFLHLAELDSAEEAFKCISNYKQDFEIMLNLGVLYAQQEKFNKAIDIILKAEKIKNDRWEIQHNLSQCYTSLGEYKKAHKCAIRALSMERNASTLLSIASASC